MSWDVARLAPFETMKPQKLRTFREFAEQEIVIAQGPCKGSRFQIAFMPFAGLLLDVFSSGRFRRFFLSGPAQAGKTLLGLIIPAMYVLFEMRSNFILAAPTSETAQAIFRERVMPSILASRYAELLPKKGGGSRGGKASAIQFGNGAILRFMGGQGTDAQRSTHEARAVGITETDKFDEAAESSREADPITQLEQRTAAWGDKALTFAECTMSTEFGRTYREVATFGTDTRPYFPCRHCGKYVALERACFTGWEQAENVEEARERAHYTCPLCRAPWTELDRLTALQQPLLVSKGQTVEGHEVVGDPPRTPTFGFRWNALASPLRTLADLAEKEWRAVQSGRDDDKKALHQFEWALPYSGELVDVSALNISTVLGKVVGHERRAIPHETVKLTLGIDVGSYVIWWALLAWRADAQGHVVDFGGITVPQGALENRSLAVLAALRAFRQDVIEPGWGGRRPDKIIVDSGYEQEVVYEFVKESGQPRYLACKGFGQTQKRAFSALKLSTSSVQVGNHWQAVVQPGGIGLVEIDSDHWKAVVHEGFSAAAGAPGSLTLFRQPGAESELREFARQILAERRISDVTPNKEASFRWIVHSRRNHYLDGLSYARVAADIEGVRLIQAPAPARSVRQTQYVPPYLGVRRSY